MKYVTLSILFIANTAVAQIQQFYKNAINATVLLYKQSPMGLVSHGTGVLFYNYDTSSDDAILVTCEHLTHHDTLVAAIPALDSIRNVLAQSRETKLTTIGKTGIVNLDFDGSNFLIKIPLQNNKNLFRHPSLDISVIYFTIPSYVMMTDSHLSHIMGSVGVAKSWISTKSDLFPGEEAIFVGFPYGIGTKNGYQGQQVYKDKKTNPLMRKGLVSWMSDDSEEYLLDGFSFGGNSGSPIFSIPNQFIAPKFVGMIIGHLNESFLVDHFFIDTTGNGRQLNVSTQEVDVNNGLARFIPAFVIGDFVSISNANRARAISSK